MNPISRIRILKAERSAFSQLPLTPGGMPIRPADDALGWGFRVSPLREPGLKLRVTLGLAWLLLGATAWAYPPAPYHTLYGTVRNEWGDPINLSGAEVFIETTNGVGRRAEVRVSTEPGVNYQMQVPMDSGTSPDPYLPTALRQSQSFLLKVQIGPTTYLPLEMTLGPEPIGAPAESTRLDLTLGEDTDNDGLPDGWEMAIISMLGGDLASITPDGDADGDGLSNKDEYLAGTYAFDPNDGFALSVIAVDSGNAFLEFLAIRGRTYTIVASTNLQEWAPVSFSVVDGLATGPLQPDYFSSDFRQLRVAVPPLTGHEPRRFFRARVQ